MLVAGLVHLDCTSGYRSAGSVPDFGRSILFNAAVSVVVAVAVATRREWFVRLAGIAVPVGTLAAFTYTNSGSPGRFTYSCGLHPSMSGTVIETS